ncbi:glutamate receptor ionotropic, kainate 3-like [Bicyclus anynana]|uniref:Glutamate receptor ionotropic, kainate 3-like n=1 Tax=Bicyclus anynana TaxID=110368 RepID=A0ABM3LKJ3_BICAN|nr:glutamate receptor ionotropic, kainate 3-like [Bicyclus anynana]
MGYERNYYKTSERFKGAWNMKQSMSSVETPYPVEARNFMREKFIVGRCNCSEDKSTAVDDDGPSAPELLDDILQFLTLRLNATSVTRYYGKLGFRTYEGAWTGLLGALMDHSVDVALEPVTAISPRHKDMDFIFPIADTMCNIYIRHQETSAVRDIFLAPFSTKLIACVVCVVLVAAIVVVIISRSTKSSLEVRQMSFIEGIIWSTGILCQQGGTRTPQNPAASIVLVVCLFFALVTYNAYAAFITSVLSVRMSSVGSLTDVLQSNMKIGYIRNGADQMYLMSTKDVQLNAFYIRGYSEAENLVSSAEEGLVRAARQDYAFFAGQRVARSTLSTLPSAAGNWYRRLQSVIAFDCRRDLRSAAVLSRLEAALVPAMPQCTPPSGFASARAADVRTALFVILAGLLAALLLD